jgi:hypothetical protein
MGNQIGNPTVDIGSHYAVAAAPMQGHRPAREGDRVIVVVHLGGMHETIGTADTEIGVARLILLALRDIHNRMTLDLQKASEALAHCEATEVGDEQVRQAS